MPVEIFCCYARKDQELLLELKIHLIPLERQGLITIWADTDIGAGMTSPPERRASMAEKVFRPPSASMDIGTVTINPEQISGQGGPAFPQLSVPLNISLGSAEPQMQHKVGTGIYIPTPDDPIQDYTLR